MSRIVQLAKKWNLLPLRSLVLVFLLAQPAFSWASDEAACAAEFDLATTVISEPDKKGSGKANISIVGVSISVEGEISNKITNNETSRIKFSIPVAFNAKPRK